jgi:hypothetical protein
MKIILERGVRTFLLSNQYEGNIFKKRIHNGVHHEEFNLQNKCLISRFSVWDREVSC